MNLNVVVDLDGVITNLDYFKTKRTAHPLLDVNHFSIKETRFLNGVFALGVSFYSKHARVRPGASEVIHTLKNQGDTISILTKRMFSADNTKTGEKIRTLCEAHLIQHDIPYDNLMFTTGTKVAECTELKADVIIEDNPRNILVLANAGFKVICFRTPYNGIIQANGKNIFVAENWEEVYTNIELIRKRKEYLDNMQLVKGVK
jgi:uncharacterized HAD superfamily protein